MIRENTALNVLPDKFFEDDASDEYSEHLEEYNDSVEGQTGLRLFPGDLLVVDVYVIPDECFSFSNQSRQAWSQKTVRLLLGVHR